MKFHWRGCRVALLISLATTAPAPSVAADAYRLAFGLRLRAGDSTAEASLELAQDRALLREARFRAPPSRFSAFKGDGEIRRDGDFVTWLPPVAGGRISFRVNLENRRDGERFDSLVTPDWALFRADDAFPPARVRHLAGARSRSSLRVRLPDGWSVVTPFAARPAGGYLVENPERAFDRPTGWLIAGKLGRRKDMIGDLEVSVAAPVGSGAERISMLALLRWTLPYLFRETATLPDRLSIVSAGEPMWRGGLSASNSVFVHAERPLLSENATSTLLHEVVHVLLPISTRPDHDWIDEGIAEYVTLRLLRDSGTISAMRFRKAIDGFAARGKSDVRDLATVQARGDLRARAVAIFADLDEELAALTDGDADIYDLVRRIRASGEPIDAQQLHEEARALTGAKTIDALEFNRAQSNDSNLTK